MRLRDARRFKTKGIFMSFGDIMLPLVGFVAIGLLLVAGKLFFFSDEQPNKRPVPVISDPSTRGGQEIPARAEASEPRKQQETPLVTSVPVPRVSVFDSRISAEKIPKKTEEVRPLALLDILAIPYDGKTESKTEDKTDGKTEKAQPVAVPKDPSPEPQKKTVKPPVKVPQVTVTVAPISTPAVAKKSSWMVQVGAFSTKDAANSVLQEMSKNGYAGNIIPGKTLFRVLLQAGSTRDEALKHATKLSGSGYPGAFIVPPR